MCVVQFPPKLLQRLKISYALYSLAINQNVESGGGGGGEEDTLAKQ